MGVGSGNGWVEVIDLPVLGERRLYVRLQPDAAKRLKVTELFVDGDGQALPAALFRELPIEQIEGYANGIAEKILNTMKYPGPPMAILASHHATVFGSRAAKHWVAQAYFSQLFGSDLPKATKRAKRGSPSALNRPPKLQVPAGSRLSDEFLSDVAAIYKWAIANNLPPAPAIFAETGGGVSIRTIQGWVAKSRKRGMLLPGQQGKKVG